MEEMCIEPLGARRQLARKHAGLAEAADPVGGRIADQITGEGAEHLPDTLLPKHVAQAFKHAQRLLVEILGQIEDRR